MSFADSFWSSDYRSGQETLFKVLFEGVKENDDFIRLFTRRMELELQYGTLLTEAIKPTSSRHSDDDYVSTVKNAFSKSTENFIRQGEYHLAIADNIKHQVLEPFAKWCGEHEQRVAFSESEIASKFKKYTKEKASLEKLQQKYFNKCRMLEDFKSRYTDEELGEAEKAFKEESVDAKDSNNEEDASETYQIGDHVYDTKQLKDFLTSILSNIELQSHKVPILGTYQNVSSGSSITQWLLDNIPEIKGNIAKAESMGQDLLENSFIRLIGLVAASKTFINSSQFWYQWKPVVFELTKLEDQNLETTGSRGNQISNYFEDVKQAIGVTSVDYQDITQFPKLLREVDALDIKYFEATKSLDVTRCIFEEIVMDHLAFMQKCEHDRLKAIKKVMFDFVATFSNKVSLMKKLTDELFVVEETIHPMSDLKFLIQNYGTGRFEPHVTLYDNYYNSNINQTFGVDLGVKARLDRKAVPAFVLAALSYLDKIYPDFEDDAVRVNLWTQPVHLSKVHQLRAQINHIEDPATIIDILAASEPLVVTNVVKLYFMELPDSVVPHSYYDLIQTLYQSYSPSKNDIQIDKTRINGLQNTLSELPVCNLATLDAILTHLNRLVGIIKAKNKELGIELSNLLHKEFAHLILRPRDSGALDDGGIAKSAVATELLQKSFSADLFANKDAIFGELRRRNLKGVQRGGSTTSTPSRETTKRQPEPPVPTKDIAPTRLGVAGKESVAANSKLRLESKMKRAVSKASEQSSEPTKIKDFELPQTPVKQVRSSSPEHGSSIKRLTSPSKRNLNSLLESASKPVVSSRPPKKDIIYSSSLSETDLQQPQFLPGLERKSSVKDMAQKLEESAVDLHKNTKKPILID